MIEKYILKDETVKRIEDIFEQRKYFSHNNCTIDALLGIDDDNYDRCRRCSNFVQVKDKICACMMELGLQELR